MQKTEKNCWSKINATWCKYTPCWTLEMVKILWHLALTFDTFILGAICIFLNAKIGYSLIWKLPDRFCCNVPRQCILVGFMKHCNVEYISVGQGWQRAVLYDKAYLALCCILSIGFVLSEILSEHSISTSEPERGHTIKIYASAGALWRVRRRRIIMGTVWEAIIFHNDLDIWSLTLKPFQQFSLTWWMFVKSFYWNLFIKYGDVPAVTQNRN